MTKYVWGAFSEALWLRFNRDKVLRWLHVVPRAPRFSLLAVAFLFVVVVIASGFAPTIRWAFSRLPYNDPNRLVELTPSGSLIPSHVDTVFITAQEWSQQSKTAESISAYSWDGGRITTAVGKELVTSARVAPNFFEVLGVNASAGRLFHPGDENDCSNCIVISHWLWENSFHGDRAILGQQVTYQGSASTIVGVLPERFWFISPEISVWTLRHSFGRAFNYADRTGVLVRLRPGVSRREAAAEFDRLVRDSGPGAAYAHAELTPIANPMRQGILIYLLFSLLALIVSAVMLAIRLARSVSPKVHFEIRDNWRWWAYFTAKTVLLLATCFVASLEGTRRALLAFTGSVPPYAGTISSWLLLVTTVLAVTWSLHDQYRRCRICLKRLEHESYVGVPARLLLDWWGTESVCSQGHGMLHVPEMKASWLEEEHWIQLDDSWKPLFDPEEAKVL